MADEHRGDERMNTIKRQEDVIRNIQKMFKSGSSNDVTIVLEDGEVKANKDVLCASSDYFATMFSNEAFDECKNGIVPMKDIKKVVMEGIIQFLFSGELNLDDFDVLQLLEMMNIAQFMFLKNLFDDLETYIDKKMNDSLCSPKIAFEGLALIYKFNFEQFKIYFRGSSRAYLDFVDNEMTEGRKAFLHLTSNIVRDLMDCPSPSQITRFKAFVHWYKRRLVPCTEDDQKLILKCFNLDEFTAKELVDYVRKSRFYDDEEIDARLSYALNEYEEETQELKKQSDDLRQQLTNERSQSDGLREQLTNERSKHNIQVSNLKKHVLKWQELYRNKPPATVPVPVYQSGGVGAWGFSYTSR